MKHQPYDVVSYEPRGQKQLVNPQPNSVILRFSVEFFPTVDFLELGDPSEKEYVREIILSLFKAPLYLAARDHRCVCSATRD